MDQPDELLREIEALRQRLSRLSAASLHINEDLDLDTVLQGVVDSARALTASRYAPIVLPDDGGGIREPLRLRDFHDHARAVGLPESKFSAADSTAGNLKAKPPIQFSRLNRTVAPPAQFRKTLKET